LRDGKFPINHHGVLGVILGTGCATLAALYLIVHDRLDAGDADLISALLSPVAHVSQPPAQREGVREASKGAS
jgi:hypothetical protein